MNRRFLLLGIGSLIAAPAVVRAENIMRVFAPKLIVPTQAEMILNPPMFVAYAGWEFLKHPSGVIEHRMRTVQLDPRLIEA
jgi:hypothetical protein